MKDLWMVGISIDSEENRPTIAGPGLIKWNEEQKAYLCDTNKTGVTGPGWFKFTKLETDPKDPAYVFDNTNVYFISAFEEEKEANLFVQGLYLGLSCAQCVVKSWGRDYETATLLARLAVETSGS